VAVPVLYGHAYRGAIAPGEIIIIGLSVEGAAAVASAYLVGIGRPGLNSIGMGIGTIVTVTLDVILIPRLGAMGGAITSAIAYLTTTVVLVLLARGQISAESRGAVAARARQEIRADSAIRRVVDLLVSGAALAIAGPVIVLLAAAVRFTSPGPAFYRQVRVGRSREPFTILKLRSMVSGADRAAALVTSHADSRVTGLGAVLRATKLDELPQLINVLKGDMTLIGPRPEVPRYIPYYTSDERETLNVRPGLTGAGQIFYTMMQQAPPVGTEDPEQHYVTHELHAKLGFDLDYLRRRGLGYDLRLVLRTVALLTGLGQRGHAPVPGDVGLTRPQARPEANRDGLDGAVAVQLHDHVADVSADGVG
jgi:lipopolysaccharide/colanic/teichoic acid biosynthesis glycosyltransferase